MKIVFDHPRLKPRRRELREKSTLSEKILWERIRNRKLGYKFLRQYSIEGYVVDYYCPKLKLAIEVEGSIHKLNQVKIYDKYRKRFIETCNIIFLVISNNEILTDINEVVEKIVKHLPLLS